jgi:sugar lactone lactonase YvrE
MRRSAVPGEFRNPQGLSIDQAGNIVVIVGCTRPPHVQVFRPSDELSSGAAPYTFRNNIADPGPTQAPLWLDTRQRTADGTFRGDGDGYGRGEWRYPIDSAIDADGRVLILDGHVIKIFDIDGNHLSSFGGSGWEEQDFISPCGIATDSRNRVLVTDNASANPHVKPDHPRGQLKVFDQNGEFQFSFGPLGADAGQLRSPIGVTTDSQDRIIVADQANNRIQIFDSAGEYVAHFGTLGTGDGELNWPFGVAVDADDEIVVADAGNNRVQIFDSSGRYLRQFGSLGVGDGEMNYPFHVAVDRRNNVVVADSGNDRVQVFQADGRYTAKFGVVRKRTVHAFGETEYNFPIGLTQDSQRNIIVSDTRNHRILVLDPDGALIRSFGELGSGRGQFHFLTIPTSLAVDARDRIHVVDSGNQRIQVFSSEGEFELEFGGLGLGEGTFNTPSGITVDSEGRIIVGDGGNSLVQVFDSAGTFLFQFGENGDGEGQFNGFQISVAALQGGRIAAVDGKNHRVQIFDSQGTFERSIGTEGVEEGNFRMPGAVSADRTGTSFAVTDPGNDRVQVFDAARGDLQNVMAVASQTCGDVVLDAQAARILVSTPANDRIQVFSMDVDI